MRQRTGSIDKTRSGKHRVRITLDGGKRETQGIYPTREKAEAQRSTTADILAAEASPGGVTLAVFGEKFITRREINAEVADSGGDWSKWRTHIASAPLAKMAMRSIKAKHIRDWLVVVRKGRAKQTVQNALNLLRVIFRSALEAEVVKTNPCKEIALPKQKRTLETWTYAIPEEQTRLMNAVDGAESLIVGVAIGTGLRAGELVALRLADVHHDVEHPHMVIRYGGTPDKPTKGGRIREVPLFGLGLLAMRAWLAQLETFAPKNPRSLAFPGSCGGFRSEDHVLRWATWLDAKKHAGIVRRFRWHDLRHTCGTSLVCGWWGRTWSLEEVKEMLGHASITTTERYAHLAGTVLQRAAEMSEKQLASKWPSLAQAPETPQLPLSVRGLPKPLVGRSSRPEGAPLVSGTSEHIGADVRGQLKADSLDGLRIFTSADILAYRAELFGEASR